MRTHGHACPSGAALRALYGDGGDRRAAVAQVGATLGWPAAMLRPATVQLVLDLARRLWPTLPWLAWSGVDGTVSRGAVPYLRRAAALLHGFGDTLPGVWEAIRLPDRRAPLPLYDKGKEGDDANPRQPELSQQKEEDGQVPEAENADQEEGPEGEEEAHEGPEDAG